MQPVTSRVVIAFLDILGFKSMLASGDAVRLNVVLAKFQAFAHHASKTPNVYGLAFSDTVVMYTDLEHIDEFLDALDYVTGQTFASTPCLLRGGIAVGELTRGQVILGTPKFFSFMAYGQAFLEAHRLSETKKVGMRMLLTGEAADLISQRRPKHVSRNEYAWWLTGYEHDYLSFLLQHVKGQTEARQASPNIADTLAVLLPLTKDGDRDKMAGQCFQWLTSRRLYHPELLQIIGPRAGQVARCLLRLSSIGADVKERLAWLGRRHQAIK